ncbi:MAG: UPF0149 family protein [Acidiferrobacterales bacterium]
MSGIAVTPAELEAALRTAASSSSAAEAHGIIAGVLCVPEGDQRVDWLALILGPQWRRVEGVDTLQKGLLALYTYTREQLQDRVFELELVLVEADRTLQERTAAIADWCRGYVLGLLQASHADVDELPGDAVEIVRDMMAIAQAESDQRTTAEEEEKALVEIEEYVRTGVELVYLELHTQQRRVPEPDEE